MKKFILLVITGSLHATAFVITSNADSGANTLREAITTLNGGPDSGSTITFNITPPTITLASPLPTINLNDPNLISIDGANGGTPVTIDGANSYIGFTINQVDTSLAPASTFTLQNLILQNCYHLGTNGAGPGDPGESVYGGSFFIDQSGSDPSWFCKLENVQFLNSKAQGGDGNGGGDGGSAAGGVGVCVLPLHLSGNCTFNGTVQSGSPAPSPSLTAAWSLEMPQTVASPAFGETISFTNSFYLLNDSGGVNFTQDGAGTVVLSTTSTSPPAGTFDPGVYLNLGDTAIQNGTFKLQGQVTQNSDGVLIPLPVLVSVGAFTLDDIATFSGSGLVIGPVGFSLSGTIQPDSGIVLLISDSVLFNVGSQVKTSVTPAAAATLMLSSLNTPSPAVNIQDATLHVDIGAGTYSGPTVYGLVLSEGLFDGKFQDIIITSSSSMLGSAPATVLYSPATAPNSVLYPVNVPYGISEANIVLGTISLPSTVLYDPCAGIIVISLIAPGEGVAALSSFFARQCSLTAQTLQGIATALNAQCLKKGRSGPASAPSLIARWHKEKSRLLAQNAQEPAPAPAAPFKEQEDEEKSSFLPSSFPSSRDTPPYSISLTPLGQFQSQNQIVTASAVLPAYSTKTGGAILGFDYLGMETILVGGAASFAWTDLTVAQAAGGQTTASAFGTIYSSFVFDQFFFNLLATGSYNHNKATRVFKAISGETITIESDTPFGIQSVYTFQTADIPGGISRSKYDTYQLVPHIDFNYEFGFGPVSLVPFILSDCSISFTRPVVETGDNFLNPDACNNKVSLNTATASLTTYILQSEVGLNLFEQIDFKQNGMLIFRQKGSYVNRYTVPYTVRAKLVDSLEYTKTSLHFPVQHMFGSSAEMIYRWRTFSMVLTYEGIVGSGYMSNAGYLRFSYDF